jgi:hypothetical protein
VAMSTPHVRDQNLRRVSRLTGRLAAAGLVVVGGFAGLLARPWVTSAKTTGVATTNANSSGAAARGSSSTSVPGQSSRSNGQATPTTTAPRSNRVPLNPPSRPPAPSNSRGPVVSGGS